MVLVREKFVRNLDGNKKNIGKRIKQKRRPGRTGEGSAGEKTEQRVAGQTEPGCGRAGEDDGESGCEVRDKSEEKVKKKKLPSSSSRRRFLFFLKLSEFSVEKIFRILDVSSNTIQERKKRYERT